MTRRAALVATLLAAAALASACTGTGSATANRSRAPARTIVTHLSYRYLTDLQDGALDRITGITSSISGRTAPQSMRCRPTLRRCNVSVRLLIGRAIGVTDGLKPGLAQARSRLSRCATGA
jgi:hypothetical protein